MANFDHDYGFDVDKHTVFLGLTGSHAYGMAREGSDVDIRGAAVPPLEIRESFYRKFDQFACVSQEGPWGPCSVEALDRVGEHETAGPALRRDGETDLCVYSLSKLVALASNANPNVLELLFLDDRDVVFARRPWEVLVEHREIFLSKKCWQSYVGYAMSQLKRIKGHREWLLNPPSAPPTRSEHGLPEESVLPADVRNQINEAVKKITSRWSLRDGFEDLLVGPTLDSLVGRMREFHATLLQCEDEMLDEKVYELAGASLGLTKDVLYAIKQERRYRSALKHWTQYSTWRNERNEARAALEAKYGYDTKHASHLIRLLRTGLEILDHKGLTVRRPDAEELLAIRDGAWSYDALIEQAASLKEAIDAAYETCNLPVSPDLQRIDALLIKALQMADFEVGVG
jgi:predicted nucleotidyltransferase